MQTFYRFGYTHYLHINDFTERKVKFLWQDVVCQYWPWAEKAALSIPAALEIKPCLPAMHAKAHTWHCQVHTRTCTCAHTLTHVHTCIHTLTYTHTYTCTHTYTHAHTHTHVHTHTHTHTHTRTHYVVSCMPSMAMLYLICIRNLFSLLI